MGVSQNKPSARYKRGLHRFESLDFDLDALLLNATVRVRDQCNQISYYIIHGACHPKSRNKTVNLFKSNKNLYN